MLIFGFAIGLAFGSMLDKKAQSDARQLSILNYFQKMRKVKLRGKDADDLHKYRTRIKQIMHVYYILPDKPQNDFLEFMV